MKLYHYSNIDTDELVPATGESRHDGEDPRAVGKAVVWLSNSVMRTKPPKQFEYVVDIDDNDPALHKDELLANGMQAYRKYFGSEGGFEWYWLERSIVPTEKRRWSATSRTYEPVR